MIKLPPMARLSAVAVGSLYLGCYVLLDIAADSQFPSALGISAWHPSVGFSLLAVLLYGPRLLPLLFLCPFAAELVSRGSLPLAMLEAAAVGSGYAVTTLVLRRPELRFDIALTSVREVFVLMVVAMLGSAIVTAGYIGLLVFFSFLVATEFSATALSYWVGDMVGIAVVTPFGLLLMTSEWPIRPNWRTAIQVAIIVFALAVAIGSAERERLQLFFLLFLPVTWIAVSSGLEGVTMALMVTQIGLVAALHYIPGTEIDVLALQARMLVLAVTGLVAGALVTEARRAEQTLRENQAAIARLSRLGSMGELAIAIAHEVNQPLSAAGTYSRLVTEALESEKLTDPGIIATAKKATAQVERAADVIRRLRALVRLGRSELSPTDIELVVEESLDLVRLLLERGDITVAVHADKDLPPVMADRIQIEQVLINLLRNSAEAIHGTSAAERRITIRAGRASTQLAEIRVSDTGPGFPPEIIGAAPTLFSSHKADGLGVGLSLCRSIIEAHGGAFRLESGDTGGVGKLHTAIRRGHRMNENIRVALIDDDDDVLDALASFLERRGLSVTSYSASRAFIEVMDLGEAFDCIVSDVRMPEMSGLELQRVLSGMPGSPPLILITGHGDIDMAVTALKGGAADFIEKPTDDERLLASIKSSVARNRETQRDQAELTGLRQRYEQLSERQREVMGLAIQGLSNKEIAVQLGISPRTVEHYREWAMERMQANNFAELVQMAAQLKLVARKR